MNVGDKVHWSGRKDGPYVGYQTFEILARTQDGRPIIGTVRNGIPNGEQHIVEEALLRPLKGET